MYYDYKYYYEEHCLNEFYHFPTEGYTVEVCNKISDTIMFPDMFPDNNNNEITGSVKLFLYFEDDKEEGEFDVIYKIIDNEPKFIEIIGDVGIDDKLFDILTSLSKEIIDKEWEGFLEGEGVV